MNGSFLEVLRSSQLRGACLEVVRLQRATMWYEERMETTVLEWIRLHGEHRYIIEYVLTSH
jgi:hypothetical protein